MYFIICISTKTVVQSFNCRTESMHFIQTSQRNMLRVKELLTNPIHFNQHLWKKQNLVYSAVYSINTSECVNNDGTNKRRHTGCLVHTDVPGWLCSVCDTRCCPDSWSTCRKINVFKHFMFHSLLTKKTLQSPLKGPVFRTQWHLAGSFSWLNSPCLACV